MGSRIDALKQVHGSYANIPPAVYEVVKAHDNREFIIRRDMVELQRRLDAASVALSNPVLGAMEEGDWLDQREEWRPILHPEEPRLVLHGPPMSLLVTHESGPDAGSTGSEGMFYALDRVDCEGCGTPVALPQTRDPYVLRHRANHRPTRLCSACLEARDD